MAVSASSWTLPVLVSVGLHVGAVRLMQGGFDFDPTPKQPPPIEVEILFEETPLPDSVSAVLEELDLVTEQTLEELAAAEDLPILEPVTADEPAASPEVDPLFLPEASEFDGLPEGLEEFVSTAPVNSNLNADLSEDMVSTNVIQHANDQSPTREQIEDALLQEEEGAEAPLGEEAVETEEPAAEPEVAEAEPAPVINYPLIPKPRPRAPPRVAAEESTETEATETVAEATTDGSGEAATADDAQGETGGGNGTSASLSAADRSAAQLAASRHVQNCFDMNMTLNHFIRYTNSWQVAFLVNIDAEGNVVSAEKGKIAFPNGASREMIDSFTDNVRETIYECSTFKNPDGVEGVPFEIELIYQPGA
ncbi:MAG: hypothetical protein ACO3NE_10550 [Alphaproteobacteria bacterium]